MATPVYLTGFEHGTTLVAGVGGGLAEGLDSAANCFVESGAKRSGGFGLRLTNAAGRAQLFNPNANVNVGAFYWRAVSKPSTGTSMVWTNELATFFNQIRYNQSSNKLEAGLDESTFTAALTTVTTNQWYRVDYKLVSSGATHTFDWKIDGTDQTQVTRGSASNESVTRVDAVCDGANACTWNFDDIILSTTSGDYPLGEVVVLGATADQSAAAEHQSITLTQWQTTSDFSAFTNFTSTTETTSRGLLDDLNNTDGVRISGTAGNARWPVADPSGDPGTAPLAVTLITASREASAGTNNAIFRTLLTASTTDHFNGNPGWGTTWNYLRTIMAAKPGTGAWSNQNVKDIRFEADSTDAAPAIWLSGFFYEIAYPPASGTTYTKAGFGKEHG